MKARFDSQCHFCGGKVSVGDEIIKEVTQHHTSGWGHKQCPLIKETFETKPLKSKVEFDVPAGRYALEGAKMFQVDRPTDGRWKGWTFVKRLIGGSYTGDYRKVRIRGAEANAVLAQIAADIEGALLRFGLTTGRCGNCGKALSDPQSLATGIGPVCADNLGIPMVPMDEVEETLAEMEIVIGEGVLA